MRHLFVICTALFLLASPLRGESFFLVDQGSSGTAKSGMITASVNDGSALFYNPAQLATVRTFDLTATGTILFPSLAYSTRTGNSYDGAKKVLPAGSLFLTVPMGERMTLGLGVTTPAQGDNSWKADFPGRYNASRFQMMANTVSFGLGVKLGQRMRFGFSADYSNMSMTYENYFVAPYYNILGGTGEYLGFYEATGLADASATASGFSAGLSADIGRRWTLSVTYRTKQEFDYENESVLFTQSSELLVPNAVASFESEFGASNLLTTGIDNPASATIALAFKPDNRWTIEVDISRYMFSEVRPYYFDYSLNTEAIVDRGMTETWEDMDVYGFSLDYKASKKITLMGGMRYASNVIPITDANPADPSSNKFHISLGISHLDEGDGWSFAMIFRTYEDETVTGQEFLPNPNFPNNLEPLENTGLFDRHSIGFSFSYHIRF